MPIQVDVEFRIRDAAKAAHRGDIIIVIDVLRCSSTIITALTNGALGIIPVKTVREAISLHKKNPDYILAGERGGIKLKNFDLGNSPLEFRREIVYGKHIILTTTSGTKAIAYSKGAKAILIGALINARSVAKKAIRIAKETGANLTILLSSMNGHFFLEDYICAGAIISEIPNKDMELSDHAIAAKITFSNIKERLLETILMGRYVQYLIDLGFKKDVIYCSQLNKFNMVPIYRGGLIKPSS